MLVIPLPSAESHTFVMVKVAQELAARGNEVLVRGPRCLSVAHCARQAASARCMEHPAPAVPSVPQSGSRVHAAADGQTSFSNHNRASNIACCVHDGHPKDPPSVRSSHWQLQGLPIGF